MRQPNGEDTSREHAAILHALTNEISAVAKLSGTVRRVEMHAAGHSVEVEWSDSPATHQEPVVEHESAPEEREGVTVVRAPLVGTFYTAPQPGAPSFISVGDTVGKGQTLAIVEAMKLMNPLLADCEGTVEEVLVGNGEPVEFDQPLIVIAPSDDQEGGP